MQMKMPAVVYDTVIPKGGLNLITPTLQMPPGSVLDSQNFEILETGAIGRIAGFERFSGQPKPSAAQWYRITLTTSFGASIPATIVDSGGTKSGRVIASDDGGHTTVGQIWYTKAVGTFAPGDVIKNGPQTIGTVANVFSAADYGKTFMADEYAYYANLAAAVYRSDIVAPTGTGAIRGVFVFNDVTYCLRDNGGGKTLYKSTASGWSAVTLYNEISFSNANTNVGDGDTLTQGGVTATIKRVVVETGTLVSGVNTGRLIITNPAGGAFAAGAATSTGAGALTLGGASTAITLTAAGKCEAVQYNFYGQTSGARMYVADSVGRMFEFDGDVLVPLTTGGLIPKHVAAHKKYLFYSVGPSIFYRAVGDPYLTTGGGEIAVGDSVTGFLVLPGSTTSASLAVFTRNGTFVLYGSSSSDWNLVSFNYGTGAFEYTLQNMADAHLVDDRGAYSLVATLAYGNFDSNSLTHQLRPWIVAHRSYLSCSSLNRQKSQYRVFYSDGWALYITVVNGKLLGAMPVYMGEATFASRYANVAWESTLGDGTPIMLIGGGDGMVYELERGTSGDGDEIHYSITFNWNAMKNPRALKRFRGAQVECSAGAYFNPEFRYLLGYYDLPYNQITSSQGQSLFDWTTFDNFYDVGGPGFYIANRSFAAGVALFHSNVQIDGSAESLSAIVFGQSALEEAWSLNSITVRYSVQRGMR